MTMKSLIEVYLSTKEIAFSERENKFLQYLLFQRLSVLQSMGHLRYLGKKTTQAKKTQHIPQGKEEKKRKKTSIYYAFNYRQANSQKNVVIFQSMCQIIETI